MKHSRPIGTSAKLSTSVYHRLNMYALAATAAGVSSLALTQPAEAKIVYTPARVKLLAAEPFALDLNHDGMVDLYLLHAYPKTSTGANTLMACHTPRTNSFGGSVFCVDSTNVTNAAIRVIEKDQAWGADLRSGATIHRGDLFPKKAPFRFGQLRYVCGSCVPRWFGPWVNGGKGVKNRYLGIKFKIKGRFHYGWARMTVTTTSNSFAATLTGYAYETIPGKGIIAGKTEGSSVAKEPNASLSAQTPAPAILGALAIGAQGLPLWRKEWAEPAQ
jgi:hypothetical protein